MSQKICGHCQSKLINPQIRMKCPTCENKIQIFYHPQKTKNFYYIWIYVILVTTILLPLLEIDEIPYRKHLLFTVAILFFPITKMLHMHLSHKEMFSRDSIKKLKKEIRLPILSRAFLWGKCILTAMIFLFTTAYMSFPYHQAKKNHNLTIHESYKKYIYCEFQSNLKGCEELNQRKLIKRNIASELKENSI